MLIAAIIAAVTAGIAAGAGGAADPFREVIKYWTKVLKKLDDGEVKTNAQNALVHLAEVMERIARQIGDHGPAFRRLHANYESTIDDYFGLVDELGDDTLAFQTDALDAGFELRDALGDEKFEELQEGVVKEMEKRQKKIAEAGKKAASRGSHDGAA